MADDPLNPPSKRGINPRSLANLLPPIAKGEVRNKTGENGRARYKIVQAFLDQPDDTELGKKLCARVGCPEGGSRLHAILQREFIAGMGKSDIARRTLIEQAVGKPPPSRDEQVLQLAEHFRQVARDSVDLALKVLGDRIQGMKPEEVAAGLQAFAVNPRGFLEAAEQAVGSASDTVPVQLVPSMQNEPPQLEPANDTKVEGEL